MKKDKIVMGHGSGGKLMRSLIKETFLRNLENPFLSSLSDSAILPVGQERIALTTDSYVVYPPFFPGGDIGKLAVAGTNIPIIHAISSCISHSHIDVDDMRTALCYNHIIRILMPQA